LPFFNSVKAFYINVGIDGWRWRILESRKIKLKRIKVLKENKSILPKYVDVPLGIVAPPPLRHKKRDSMQNGQSEILRKIN
jgi:hypothetical protein